MKPENVPASGTDGDSQEALREKMLRIAHMFAPHQNVPLMRRLCRAAIHCLQEEIAARD